VIGVARQLRWAAEAVYDRFVPDALAFVDAVANELATWPGVRIERRADGAATVGYEHSELSVLYPDRGVAELPVLGSEHDALIERGDAEPAERTAGAVGVSHPIHGPADITEVLELFDRRYRDVRGEDDPYASQDPDHPQGRLDQR
jgi:Luciferase